jgi:hypothetical protein
MSRFLGENFDMLIILSGIMFLLGVGLSTFSQQPITIKIPYEDYISQKVSSTLVEDQLSSTGVYYFRNLSLVKGDVISIYASISEGTLSATVNSTTGFIVDSHDGYILDSQDNVKTVDLRVIIPSEGKYSVEVSRYRPSVDVVYLTKVNADVSVKLETIKQVKVIRFIDDVQYPNKIYEAYGCGVAILSGFFSFSLIIARKTKLIT